LLTKQGIRTFAELENQAVRVLTDDGFKPALVKRFRRKPLVKIELAPAFEERDRYGGTRLTTRNISKFRRSVWATPTHRWLLVDGDPVKAGSWRLRSTDHEALAWLEAVAPYAGYVVVGSGEEGSRETNFGVRTRPIRWLYLATRELSWRVTSVDPREVDE